MSVIFAAASMGVGFLVARPVLALMGAEGHLLDLALKYTDIYFIGLPFTALSNYAISILRARGDTKTPLLVLSMTGLMNVGLNLMFVLAFDMSVDGVAWATAIANATSALVLLLRLSRDKGACRFSLRKLGIDRSSFRSILTIGLPAGVQGALFALSNMLIQSSILQVNNAIVGEGARFNPVVKGNAAVANLEGFAYTSVNSVYQGAITFTSQNVGAAKYQRVKRVMACCYATAAAVAVLASGTLFLLREPLLSLYDVAPAAADSLEQVAFDTALCRMMYTWIPYFLLSTMEIGCGILRGLGRSLTSTVVSLMGACVFRVIWISTVFRAVGTLESIYLSYPISWGLTGLVLFLFSVKNLRHLIKTKKSEEELLAAAGR